ncbi:hypothetical protein [Streptomyces canus]|uniref:hypothetical protein n=1 Tax=Streptomyces canus TaxID=58343 RepID=UPI003CFB02F4
MREGRHAAALALGSRGRGGIAEFLIGSVMTAAAYATCPVIALLGRHGKRIQPVTHGGGPTRRR